MGSRLAGRIARLERRPGGPRAACRHCRGFGVFALVDEGRGQTIAQAKGCPSCGKVSKIILLEADDHGPSAG